MKQLFLALTLLSTQLCTAQTPHQINWNEDEFELVSDKIIAHYEKSEQRGDLHRLFENAYGKQPDYIGITLSCALEKHFIDYLKQNPDAINECLSVNGIDSEEAFFKDQEFYEIIRILTHEMKLNITNEKLKILTIFVLSQFNCLSPALEGKFNLFREVIEFAYRQIQ